MKEKECNDGKVADPPFDSDPKLGEENKGETMDNYSTIKDWYRLQI
jgi:hypothetical protein